MTLLKLAPSMAFKIFKFPDPDTNKMFEAASFDELIRSIRMYRAQNDLEEIEYLEAIVHHHLCKLPEHIGACERGKRLKRGLIPFIKGSVLLLKSLMYNQFVTQEVADERASTCASCPLNVFPDKGPFVAWSDELAVMTVGERKAKEHNNLGTCEGCGCPLRCKVWYGGNIILTKKERSTIEAGQPKCWQL
jgi:hypothetical protein